MKKQRTVKQQLASVAKLLLVLIGVAGAFWLGAKVGSSSTDSSAGRADLSPAVDAEYWTCSMHPQIRQSGPGQCPICGMDLIPVAGEAKQVKKVKYACSMMCIPPVDRPGECPVCGMEMMPVEEHGGEVAAEAMGENVLNEVTLSPTAQKLARVQTAPVERKFVSMDVRMVGKIDYDETRLRAISSRVPGRLDRLYVDYTGIPVREGDHLVQIYSPELLAAQEELIQALKSFNDGNAGRSDEVQRIRRESLDATRQKLSLWGLTDEQLAEIEQRGTPTSHLTIYAPMGGIVIEKPLTEGAYVEEGTVIYRIADLSQVWVKLDAYELDLSWIHYGQDVEFTSEAYPGETFHGMIAFIDPILNERTRTAKVRVNVPNEDGRLKPGMFVRAVVRSRLTAAGKVMDPVLSGKWICPMHPEVIAEGPDACPKCGMPLVTAESLGYEAMSVGEAEPPLVIPATAPLITGPRAVVYVALENQPGRYQGREVVLGPRAGDYYLVREGLSEGESVVVHGNLYVDSAAQILAKPSMMSPRGDVANTVHAYPHEGAAPSAGRDTASGSSQHGKKPMELPEAARDLLDRVYQTYFDTQYALSHDQFEKARNAARDFTAAAAAFAQTDLSPAARKTWSALEDMLRKSAEGIVSARDVTAARAAFEGASNAITNLAREFGPGKRDRLLLYHCPMAFDDRGASWLQEKEGVENPYFGSAMFRCGVLKETIASGSGTREGGK